MSVLLEIRRLVKIKQLIVSTSTSVLMKLMIAPKMNCVLILMDRTSVTPCQVSFRFQSSVKNAKIQNSTKLKKSKCNSDLISCKAESHVLLCRYLTNYSYNHIPITAANKWWQIVTRFGDKGNSNTRYVTIKWQGKEQSWWLLNALRTKGKIDVGDWSWWQLLDLGDILYQSCHQHHLRHFWFWLVWKIFRWW